MNKTTLALFVTLLAAVPAAYFAGRAKPKIVYRDVVKEVKVKVPAEPLPRSLVSYRSRMDAARLFNGIQTSSTLNSSEGDIASIERNDSSSYQVSFDINIRIPKPNDTLESLTELNQKLPAAIPGLPSMMQSASVSGFYYHLYDRKQKQVQSNLTRLESALSRHNFFDCETILELVHPESERQVMLIQGEMDVVSDGTDSDRIADLSAYPWDTPYFQSTTSYAWKKQTDTPNPIASKLAIDLEKAKERYKVVGLTRAENSSLEYKINNYPKKIAELKARSFLIAREDPFIVIPLSMHDYTDANEFIPKMGDFAVVIHEDKLLPAIIGDYGPKMKMGEASLRIAQYLNDKASSYSRPVSDLTVTYVIFPGSRFPISERSTPDLAKWRNRCSELLEEVGGIGEGFTLHEWEDRFAKPEEPVEESIDGETPHG